MKGEMGIEKSYNDVMTGVNGFVEYQKDLNGWREFSETARRSSEILSWTSSD